MRADGEVVEKMRESHRGRWTGVGGMEAEWGTVGECLSEETSRVSKKTQTNFGGDKSTSHLLRCQHEQVTAQVKECKECTQGMYFFLFFVFLCVRGCID